MGMMGMKSNWLKIRRACRQLYLPLCFLSLYRHSHQVCPSSKFSICFTMSVAKFAFKYASFQTCLHGLAKSIQLLIQGLAHSVCGCYALDLYIRRAAFLKPSCCRSLCAVM